jgi:hypothetical protein
MPASASCGLGSFSAIEARLARRLRSMLDDRSSSCTTGAKPRRKTKASRTERTISSATERVTSLAARSGGVTEPPASSSPPRSSNHRSVAAAGVASAATSTTATAVVACVFVPPPVTARAQAQQSGCGDSWVPSGNLCDQFLQYTRLPRPPRRFVSSLASHRHLVSDSMLLYTSLHTSPGPRAWNRYSVFDNVSWLSSREGIK